VLESENLIIDDWVICGLERDRRKGRAAAKSAPGWTAEVLAMLSP